jgi:hypothetical protein
MTAVRKSASVDFGQMNCRTMPERRKPLKFMTKSLAVVGAALLAVTMAGQASSASATTRTASVTRVEVTAAGPAIPYATAPSAVHPDYANSCSGRVCMILETVGNGFFRVSAYAATFQDFYGHYQILLPGGGFINSPDGQQTSAVSDEFIKVLHGTGVYCVVGWRLAHQNPNLYVNVGEPCNTAS